MSPPLAERDRHPVPVWLVGLPTFLYTCFIAAFSSSGFPAGLTSQGWLPWLADKPVGEDGFYMLAIAWNIAGGTGPVPQPGAEPTTGIQPLATAIFAGIAWVVQLLGGDKWWFLRCVIVFGGATAILFSFLLGRLARELAPPEARRAASSMTLYLAIGCFFLWRLFTYGLETGVYLILVSLVVLCTLRVVTPQATWGSAVGLGVLVGLTGLARIDFGIVFVVAASVLLASRAASFAWLAVCALTALVIVSPWFAWVHHVSGALLPSSARAQAGLVPAAMLPGRAVVMGAAFVQHVSPWSYTGARLSLTLATVFTWVVLAIALVCWRQTRARVLAPGRARVVLAWFMGLAVLMPIYTLLFWAGHFYARYTAPLCVLTLPLIGSALAGLIANRGTLRTARCVYVAMLGCFAIWALASLHTGNIGNTHVLSAGFIGNHFSERRVGAFQSGVIGYFNENVINLDGKINGEALRAWTDGRLAAYVDDARIEVLIDWPGVLRSSFEDAYLRAKWVECTVQPPLGKSLCLAGKKGVAL